jgi:hypothetical protein
MPRGEFFTPAPQGEMRSLYGPGKSLSPAQA